MLNIYYFFYALHQFYYVEVIFKFNIKQNIYFVIQNINITIKNIMCFSDKDEEDFYNSIEDKLSYSVLTKTGTIKKMFLKEYKKKL